MDFFSDPQNGAHQKAKSLMKEDFFWSPIAESGPFGSDSGSDAAAGFHQWRKKNKTADPVDYLRELFQEWGFPMFDWSELDPSKIADYIQPKPYTRNISEDIEQFKAALKNSPGGMANDINDEMLEETIRMSSQNMGGVYLLEIDNGIIGTGFAQFVIEGKIDTDLQYLTHTALKRQLLPILIDRYTEEYKEIRKNILTKMLHVIENANL
jgi:uncharacterized protein YfeS